MWIRWIRIRIRNTGSGTDVVSLTNTVFVYRIGTYVTLPIKDSRKEKTHFKNIFWVFVGAPAEIRSLGHIDNFDTPPPSTQCCCTS